MARGTAPGRLLVVAAVSVAILYGLVALGGQWTPRLGLDLGGGTRLSLVTSGDPSAGDLAESRDVVASRLEDAGVADARVRARDDALVVEVPRDTGREVLTSVARPADLQVRLVAASRPATDATDQPSPDASPSAAASPSEAPTLEGGDLVDDPVAWARQPDADSVSAFESFTCPPDGRTTDPGDATDRPVLICDGGLVYLLSAVVAGSEDLDGVDAVLPPGQAGWAIQLDLEGQGRDDFTEMSRALAGTDRVFAVLVDGQVVAAPRMSEVVADGRPVISTGLEEEQAEALATSLRYGALPAAFEDQPSVEPVGASLPTDRLGAGLLAGLVALLLLALGASARYRLLGLVAPLALVVGAAVTHAMVLLLGRGIGLTVTTAALAALGLTLALVVASALLALEAVRAERLAGASPSAAVERGLHRATWGVLPADAVVAAAAVVLYVVGTGPLDGLAILLLVAAAVDLVVRVGVAAPALAWLAGSHGRDRLPAPTEQETSSPVLERSRTWYAVAAVATALAAAGLVVRPLTSVVEGGSAVGGGRALVAAAVLAVLVLAALAVWTRRWQAVVAVLVAALVTGVVTAGALAWTGLALTSSAVAAGLVVLVVAFAAAAVVLGAHLTTTRGQRGRVRHREAAAVALRGVLAWPAGLAVALALPALALLLAAVTAASAQEATSLAVVLLVGTLMGAWSTVCVLVPLLVDLEERDPAVRDSDRRAAARRKDETRKDERARRDVVPSGTTAGAGRTPARARGPVQASGSARRQQPTRTTRAKRGKK